MVTLRTLVDDHSHITALSRRSIDVDEEPKVKTGRKLQ